MPFMLLETCALRSDKLSLRQRVPLHPSYCAGSWRRSSIILSSLNLPALTSFSDFMAAPSWYSSRE